jgi:hypothetical protein
MIPLTVDSGLIKADSVEFTADQTVKGLVVGVDRPRGRSLTYKLTICHVTPVLRVVRAV